MGSYHDDLRRFFDLTMSTKTDYLHKLYDDFELYRGDSAKICELISKYVAVEMAGRYDVDAQEEALSLYEQIKDQAINAGYMKPKTLWED